MVLVLNPFLFISSFSWPCYVQTLFSLNCLKGPKHEILYQIKFLDFEYEMEDVDVFCVKYHVISFVPQFQTKPTDPQPARIKRLHSCISIDEQHSLSPARTLKAKHERIFALDRANYMAHNTSGYCSNSGRAQTAKGGRKIIISLTVTFNR